MNRSGYIDDCDDELETGRWRAQVASAIRGKRGQTFLRDLAVALDAMPVKELIAEELITEDGDVCAIGAVCKHRGLNVSNIDPEDPESVGKAVGIAYQLAAEIAYQNDEQGDRYEYVKGRCEVVSESPAERWTRMRTWVGEQIKGPK